MSSTRSVTAPPVFANSALTVIPPTPVAGVSYRDPAAGPASSADGWPYGERVNSAEWNQLVYQWSSLLGIIDTKGMLGWTNLVNYTVPAITMGSNGIIYLAVAPSGPSTAPQDPISSPLFWTPLIQKGITKFTSAGAANFAVPLSMQLGIIKPRVTVVGGGGGGGGVQCTTTAAGGGGGGGGGVRGIVDLTGITTVSLIVGPGGLGGQSSNGWNGGNGGTSSFGAFMTASGGQGGIGLGSLTATQVLSGGEGGYSSLGDLNVRGNGGTDGTIGTVGAGGVTYGGNGGGAAFFGGGRDGGATIAGQNGASYGEGGSGAGVNNAALAGGSGATGIIVIEW